MQLKFKYPSYYFHCPSASSQIYNIHQLFAFYDNYFFNSILQSFTTIQWSTRMTLCAGICEYKQNMCSIRLSQPLLKYRTSNQLKQTILHQMIHAYLFKTNIKSCMKDGGHGEQFKQIMRNINQITKLNVTVYHNFHDEVNFYKSHVWRCNGICKDKQPYYGYVRRAMNRKPQKADKWWHQHQKSCGGQFIKISGQEKQGNQIKKQLKNGKKLKNNNNNNNNNNHNNINLTKTKTIQQYINQMQTKNKKSKQFSKTIEQFSQDKFQQSTNYFLDDINNYQHQHQNHHKYYQQYQQFQHYDESIWNQNKQINQNAFRKENQFISRQSNNFIDKNNNKQKKQKSKSKNKIKKQVSVINNRKISDWMSKKTKTIQEYVQQIEKQKKQQKKQQNKQQKRYDNYNQQQQYEFQYDEEKIFGYYNS